MCRGKRSCDIALKYFYHIFHIDHQSFSITYNDLEEIYREKRNNCEALEYYQQSFNNIDGCQFATLHNNMGQKVRSMRICLIVLTSLRRKH